MAFKVEINIKKSLEAKVLEVAQKLTLDIHKAVVLGSPVDTGTFRAAWTVEIPSKPFEDGVIGNATEYGPALIHGHSKQAPNGWVDNAVEAATKL